MRALLGDVARLDVLDAGCAAGGNAEWLARCGARVTAIDASAAMVDLARERVGDVARVERADLSEPLLYPDGSFDLVCSSLTLHYLESWVTPLAEFKRVLRPGGRLVVSTHHPYLTAASGTDYHRVRLVVDRWTGFGAEPLEMRFYHRPLERIINDIGEAGFALSRIVEPKPTEALARRDASYALKLQAHPWFLFVDARAPRAIR